MRNVHIRLEGVSLGSTALAGGGISLDLARGDILSVVGLPNAGKTSLLRILAGLSKPRHGKVWIGEKEVTRIRQDVGFVFKDPLLLPWRTLLQNVILAGEIRRMDPAVLSVRARFLLALLGLTDAGDLYPDEVSQESRRRTAICRALVQDPPILLIDDPFDGLDTIGRERLCMDLQRLWQSAPRTVVIVTRSIEEAVILADQILILPWRGGTLSESFRIDLSRPRRLDKALSPLIGEYANRIRTAFHAQGFLP